MKYRIYDIEYDLDGDDETDLPTELIFECDDIDQENIVDILGDYISDVSGYLHNEFSFGVVEN